MNDQLVHELIRASVLVGVSLALVLSVLFLLGAIFRAANEKLKNPVSLIHEAENDLAIFLDGSHLPAATHDGRYARIEFRTAIKEKPFYVSRELKLRVRNRRDYISDSRICIENETFDEIKRLLPATALSKEGKYDVISQPLYVKVRFRSAFNVKYLLKHPDLSARATAWVFILTSAFSVAQALLLRWLGF